jgi:hypothetical protein
MAVIYRVGKEVKRLVVSGFFFLIGIKLKLIYTTNLKLTIT